MTNQPQFNRNHKAHYSLLLECWVVIAQDERGYWDRADTRTYSHSIDAELAAAAMQKGEDIDAFLRRYNRPA